MKRDWAVRFEIGMEMILESGYHLTVDTAAYGQYGVYPTLCPSDEYVHGTEG